MIQQLQRTGCGCARQVVAGGVVDVDVVAAAARPAEPAVQRVSAVSARVRSAVVGDAVCAAHTGKGPLRNHTRLRTRAATDCSCLGGKAVALVQRPHPRAGDAVNLLRAEHVSAIGVLAQMRSE